MLNDVINIPKKLREQNTSFYKLLEKSGYFEFFSRINEVEILGQLNINPELVQQWMQYSDDKRITSGWYFTQDKDLQYVVGYHPRIIGTTPSKFNNIKEACAAFIKIEIEEARRLQNVFGGITGKALI